MSKRDGMDGWRYRCISIELPGEQIVETAFFFFEDCSGGTLEALVEVNKGKAVFSITSAFHHWGFNIGRILQRVVHRILSR